MKQYNRETYLIQCDSLQRICLHKPPLFIFDIFVNWNLVDTRWQ